MVFFLHILQTFHILIFCNIPLYIFNAVLNNIHLKNFYLTRGFYYVWTWPSLHEINQVHHDVLTLSKSVFVLLRNSSHMNCTVFNDIRQNVFLINYYSLQFPVKPWELKYRQNRLSLTKIYFNSRFRTI